MNVTFLCLVTKLSTSNHGGELLKEIYIYSEYITPSPGYLKGWRILKMIAVALGPKIFSRTHIVTLSTSRSNPLTEIYIFSN